MISLNDYPAMDATEHFYSLSCTGAGTKWDFGKMYATREQAEKRMYKLLKKFDAHIVETYDDNHDKTYVCNRSICFYIQRYC